MKAPSKLLANVKKLFTVDMSIGAATSVFMETLFWPFDKLCSLLARKFDYFKPQTITHSLFETGFTPPNADDRENFIPVRLKVFLDKIREEGKNRVDESPKMWDDFIKMSAARFHYDLLEDANNLRDAFAPFDPDSDAQYELQFDPLKRERHSRSFFRKIDALLTASNYFELPRDVVDHILQLRRPDALPVKAIYDDFLDYKIYARGVRPTPKETFPRWKTAGRCITIQSEVMSRVCVVARVKDGALLDLDELDRKTQQEQGCGCDSQDANDQEQESRKDHATDRITVKLFKDVALEHMTLVAPRVQLKFPIFDGIKILGTFGAGATTAIVKMVIAAFSVVAALLMAFAFILAFVKSALGFVHKRTAYLQKYANRIYYHTIASNLTAIDALVTAAEEQEIKEFTLGYYAALRQKDWATEREIDDAAEAWMRERFGIDVDFESEDALRKLREKGILEERPGENAPTYRVKSLDETLAILDKAWDEFFEYN